MRLYAVERKDNGKNVGYYWADNGNDAINQHRLQTHEDTILEAYQVWANNSDKSCRGYVVMEDNENKD